MTNVELRHSGFVIRHCSIWRSTMPETKTLERRFLAAPLCRAQVVARAEGEPPKITGYAAVFYNSADAGTQYELWSDLVERIMPGAFDRALREDDVRALFNHDPSLLLGRTEPGTLKLAVDAVGLRYEIDPPATQLGRDVAESIKRGDLSGSSFSFIADAVTWRKQADAPTVREVVSVRLFDVGPVTFPAYTATSAQARSGQWPGTSGQQDREALLAERDAWLAQAQKLSPREKDAIAAAARCAELGV
jgi:HK97 family phage prohead protease